MNANEAAEPAENPRLAAPPEGAGHDSAAEGVAAENQNDRAGDLPAGPDGKSSGLARVMYYWVLSRF